MDADGVEAGEAGRLSGNALASVSALQRLAADLEFAGLVVNNSLNH